MDNSEYSKEMSSSQFDEEKQKEKDYQFLIQKLKIIKESISLLEKKVSEKDI